MLKGRRAGTFTLGLMLIVFGVLFLLRIFLPTLSFSVILSLWPIVFVSLGIEVLIAYFVNDAEKLRYDLWGVALILVLGVFAMAMGCTDYLVHHAALRL